MDSVRGLAGKISNNRSASNEVRIGTVLDYEGDSALVDLAGKATRMKVMDSVVLAVGDYVTCTTDRRNALVLATVGSVNRTKPPVQPLVQGPNPLPPDYDPAYPDWSIYSSVTDYTASLSRVYTPSGGTWSTVTSDPQTFTVLNMSALVIYDNAAIASAISGAYEFTEVWINIGLKAGTSVTADLKLHTYNTTNYPTSGAPTFVATNLITGNNTWGWKQLDTARVAAHFQNSIGGVGLTVTATSGSFPGLNLLPPTWGQIRIGTKEVVF